MTQGQHDFATALIDTLDAAISKCVDRAWKAGVTDAPRGWAIADALAIVAAEQLHDMACGDVDGPARRRFVQMMRNRMLALADQDENQEDEMPKPVATDAWGRPVPSGVLKIKGDDARSGRCYELAARTLFRTPEREGWVLVHGNFLRPDRTRYGHAWLQTVDGQYLYCAVWNVTMRMDYAQSLLHPRVHTVYTKAEARRMVDLTGQYGPRWPLAKKVPKK